MNANPWIIPTIIAAAIPALATPENPDPAGGEDRGLPLGVPKKGESFTNVAGIRMIWVKPGTFVMGSPPDEEGRLPDENQVDVTLTKGYWLGATEVTLGQFSRLMGTNHPRRVGTSDQQPTQAGLSQILEFCKKLTERDRAAGRLPAGYYYFLPTEAQWEYACRAGTKGPYAGKVEEMGWFLPDYPARLRERGLPIEDHAREVARKKPNAWGFYDMHGNLQEWCADWYAPRLQGGIDPVGPFTDLATDEISWLPQKQTGRVRRGGTAHGLAVQCRSAARDRWGPTERWTRKGFRLALRPVPEAGEEQPKE